MFTTIAHAVTRRARAILAVSVLATVLAGVLGAGVFDRFGAQGYNDPSSDSTKAKEIAEQAFGGSPDLVFLVTTGSGTLDDPAARQAGKQITQRLRSDSDLASVTSWFDTRNPGLRSKDGKQALILARIDAPDEKKQERAGPILDRYNDTKTGPTELLVGGPLGADLNRQSTSDVALAESIAIPVTILLLVVVFGSIVAALVPLLMALISVVVSLAALFMVTQFTDVSVFALNLITALGLGLSVDYALLMVSRYNEELARGADVDGAIRTTIRTAGKTVMFSAVTVIAALSSLFVFPPYFVRSFAYAGIAVVAGAIVSAVIVLPALLKVLGRRVNAGRISWIGRRTLHATPERAVWARLAATVLRRPAWFALPVLAVLLALASPLLGLSLQNPDDRVLAQSAPAHQVGDALRGNFAGSTADNLDVFVKGDTSPAQLGEFAAALSRVKGTAAVATSIGTWSGGAMTAPANPASAALQATGLQRVSAGLRVDPASDEARSVVGQVRDLAAPTGTRVLVGGPTATTIDDQNAIVDRLWLAGLVIVAATFVLLFLFTGSVVQPLRALLSNVVTLSATLGIAVWVFQRGHGADALGFTAQPLNLAILLLSVCIAFGLSMDYEVFLLGRIKELRDRGASTAQAVVSGVGHTGRIITSCALLLSVSFFAFLTGNVSMTMLLGLATGLAIIIDATVVRAILVPAAMGLLGDKAWYAPNWLGRVHDRYGFSEAEDTPTASLHGATTQSV
ncbi:MMPL family transporter [Streptomyces sp. NPDC053086]|uniref:MMPL family transporter n=1 Tax=unclassified Streptomyces TaxID=2593676 RepID=UPI0037D10319